MTNKEITSKIIGQLKQDDQFPDWWKSEPVEIPFFDNIRLTVTFMDFDPDLDEAFIEEADIALTNFLKLSTDDRDLVSKLAYENFQSFLDIVDFDEVNESLTEIKSIHEIWNFIHPTEIYVTRRPYKEQDIYIAISCGCDWEEEHGLQLVFRQGRQLTRISDHDGHLTEADACGKPDEEDELLSKFK